MQGAELCPGYAERVFGVLSICLIIIVATLCAVVFRRLACPGWAVLGGVAAGMLLGPTIFGRVMPEMYERALVGGVQQRLEMRQLQGKHGAERLAMQHTNAQADDMADLLDRHAREMAAAEASLADARWRHQSPQRVAGVVLVALTLAGAGVGRTRTTGPVKRTNAIEPLTIGLWSAAVPGCFAAVAAVLWWNRSPGEAGLIAAAVMIGPWALTSIDRRLAIGTEPGGRQLVEHSGVVATACAIGVAAWALWWFQGARGALWAVPMLAVFGAFLMPATRVMRRAIRFVVSGVIVPSLAASVMVKVELLSHAMIWPMLVLLILSGDGRWLGAFLGAMLLGGRRAAHAAVLALGSMAAGPTQLALIALAAHAWLLEMPFVYALMLGVVYVEISPPLRRWFAREVADTSSMTR